MSHPIHTAAIDLGTSYFCIFVDDELVPMVYGREVHASAVHIENGWDLASSASTATRPTRLKLAKLLIGRTLKDGRLKDDVAVVPGAKMGQNGAVYAIPNDEITPEEVSGYLFGRIKRMLDAQYPDGLQRIVLPMPAYFNYQQRQATLDAAFIGGFDRDILHTVEEPVAAVIDFIESRNDPSTYDKKRIVVVDVGGGTTDCTAVFFEIVEGKHVYVIVGTAGDNHLGGFDFDKALARLVRAKAGELPYEVDDNELLLGCEQAKEQLSSAKSAKVTVPALDRNRECQSVKVTGEEFVKESASILQAIRRVVDDLVEERNDTVDADCILAVGGICSMPAVSDIVVKRFPDAEFHCLKPSQTVGRGAARFAADTNIEVRTVLPRSLGIEVHLEGGPLSIQTMVRRNTPLPIQLPSEPSDKDPRFCLYTNLDDQAEIEFELFEGEASQAAQSISLGTFWIRDIPPFPKGKEILVSFDIPEPRRVNVKAIIEGRDGALEVESSERVTGETLTKWRQETTRRLDDADGCTDDQPVAADGTTDSVSDHLSSPCEGLTNSRNDDDGGHKHHETDSDQDMPLIDESTEPPLAKVRRSTRQTTRITD